MCAQQCLTEVLKTCMLCERQVVGWSLVSLLLSAGQVLIGLVRVCLQEQALVLGAVVAVREEVAWLLLEALKRLALA